MQKVVLTFDYELFLGLDSGTAQNSILIPTNEVIKLLKKYNAKAIFFVDITYLLTLQKYNHKDLDQILRQLKELRDLGSSIELHLHPQWLDAKPNKDRWFFDSFERYRLHSLDEKEIKELFDKSVSFMQKELNIKPIAFRAGGWSVMPFGKLKDAFVKNGIKIDMSVLPGFYKNEMPMHFYDFRVSPKKEYYRFEYDVNQEQTDGQFLEIPVTTFYLNGFDLVINNIINKLKKEKWFGDGRGLASSNVRGNLIKRVFLQNIRKATIENQSSYIFKKSFRKIKDKELLSYVMHPKTLNKTSLNNLEFLLQKCETLNSQDLLKEFF